MSIALSAIDVNSGAYHQVLTGSILSDNANSTATPSAAVHNRAAQFFVSSLGGSQPAACRFVLVGRAGAARFHSGAPGKHCAHGTRAAV